MKIEKKVFSIRPDIYIFIILENNLLIVYYLLFRSSQENIFNQKHLAPLQALHSTQLDANPTSHASYAIQIVHYNSFHYTLHLYH